MGQKVACSDLPLAPLCGLRICPPLGSEGAVQLCSTIGIPEQPVGMLKPRAHEPPTKCVSLVPPRRGLKLQNRKVSSNRPVSIITEFKVDWRDPAPKMSDHMAK
jgi:hypothetical protein